MAVEQYMVDAFATNVFEGNQAAVCVTRAPLSDELMQSIAQENNFSETAFLVPQDASAESPSFQLRWFTPGGEIDLCGHATLAAAFVVGRFVEPGAQRVTFDTCSGVLPVRLTDGEMILDMPAYELRPVPVTDAMERTFGVRPVEAWMARDLICVLPCEQDVQAARPSAADLEELEGLLQVATAHGSAGSGCDCVSRCFAPKLGVYEDPVTGSSHCALAPLWAQKLGRPEIRAFQASPRTGVLRCQVDGDRVLIAGPAVLYARAELAL